MQGSLKDMTAADLIQHTCLDRKQARLVLQHQEQTAEVYFDAGQMVHATLGDTQGKEVIFQVLDWQDGTFHLESGVTAPQRSIHEAWTEILLEGARRLDEAQADSRAASPSRHSADSTKEVQPMAVKKKSELLAEALENLLAESSDIVGAAVVGIDGLVYSANVPQKGMDEAMVGAASAAILGLGKRSVQQLHRGAFKQTLIQGDEGNIIVAPLNDETLFVALTPANVNLGMAFAEVRSIAKELQDIL